MSEMSTYYKYRSLENWQYVLDIFLNNRLYAAPFTSLNDPMEGENYWAGPEERGMVRTAIAARREQWNICSLTPKVDSTLMWAYYANGAKGIAIGVKLDQLEKDDIGDSVSYDSNVYVQPGETSSDEIATTILFRKKLEWSHEYEYRVLTRRRYIGVKIVEVHLGPRIEDSHRQLIEKLVELAVPSAKILTVSHYELKQD